MTGTSFKPQSSVEDFVNRLGLPLSSGQVPAFPMQTGIALSHSQHGKATKQWLLLDQDIHY
jgi:hypothetical protein